LNRLCCRNVAHIEKLTQQLGWVYDATRFLHTILIDVMQESVTRPHFDKPACSQVSFRKWMVVWVVTVTVWLIIIIIRYESWCYYLL
jgi:hypothetical protein